MNRSALATSLWLGLAGVLGCGPQRLGNLDDGTAASTSETSSSGESTSETESTTEDTTATTTEDTGDDPTDPDSNDTFVPEFDMVKPDCDPYAQDCDEGEKCVAYASSGGSWDANKCVPVLGDQHAGEPCVYGGAVDATDDCDATSACWDINNENVGECHPFCTGTADAPECPMGSFCLIAGGFSPSYCISICDPLVQDCDPGRACFFTGSEFQCMNTTQDIPSGSPCGFINDCALGNICTAAESLPACDGASCCALFCDLDQGDVGCEPQPGTACVAMFELGMAPPGYEHIGICQLP